MNRLISFYQKQDKVIFYSVFLALLCFLIVVHTYAFFIPVLPSQIPLFYSLPWGEAQLSSLGQFIILPTVILLTGIINLFISWHLHDSQIVLKRILNMSTALVAVLVTITALKIIFTFV